MSQEKRAGNHATKAELDRLAQRGGAWLRQRHLGSAWRRELLAALSWAWVGPCLLVAMWLGAWLFGFSHDGFTWFVAAFLAAAIPAIELGRGLSRVWRRRFGRDESLGLLDERLELADRLRTADEFLDRSAAPSELGASFRAAAIADAESRLEHARSAQLAQDALVSTPSRAALWSVVVAGAFGVLAVFLPALERGGGVADVTDAVETARRGAALSVSSETDDVPDALVPPTDENTPFVSEPGDPSREAARGSEEGTPSALPDDAKEVEGKSARGESGEASSAAGSSQARGVPSDQGQSSKGAPKKPAKKKKPKDPKEATDQDPTKRKEGEESGSTAGLGSASGSNKNPASTSWSSKDQVTDTEDEEIEDDEEVEDEDSESEARGGVQPSLRDRKPAASRDLSIGFGNRPNPNARGRGGPSQPKKSRGTASLILGVPIPDHVKGQPNPGKTKITQERIEPKGDPLVPAEASARDARRAPVGRVAEPTLTPWMRDLVRAYFLEVRARGAAPSKPNDESPRED